MAIKTKYETSDGKIFGCKSDATKHENSLMNQNLKPEILDMINKMIIMLENVSTVTRESRTYEGDEYLGMLKTILITAVNGDANTIQAHLEEYYSSEC